ncbi:MAG TPA: acyl carrier protein [Anaerolineae bacterium]
MSNVNVGDLHVQVVNILNDVMQMDLGLDTQDVQRQQVEQWDSVNHLRLVLELEQAFGVTLSDEDVLSMQSLREIETALQRFYVSEPR